MMSTRRYRFLGEDDDAGDGRRADDLIVISGEPEEVLRDEDERTRPPGSIPQDPDRSAAHDTGRNVSLVDASSAIVKVLQRSPQQFDRSCTPSVVRQRHRRM
jgi:hypothetical protein